MPIATQLPIALAICVLLLVLLAERFHRGRMDIVTHLATGPGGQLRRWVRFVPATRATTLALMAWALSTLLLIGGDRFGENAKDREEDDRDRIVFVADLSPSMHLTDAGPNGDQTRAARMFDVVDALLKRIESDVLFSVVSFYTDAIPAIVDAEDPELVRNIFAGLPVWYVMESGKTDLSTGVRTSLQHLKSYPPRSTTLFICTDGDSLPLTSIPKPPTAIRDVYVLGVGDPNQGTFIDDHMSRQDAATLRLVAGRLGGRYLDVNEKHVPTLSMGRLARGTSQSKPSYGLVDIALWILITAASTHALIPVALEYFGSDWRAVRPSPEVATSVKEAC